MENIILSPVSLDKLGEIIEDRFRKVMADFRISDGQRRIYGYKGLADFMNCSEPKALELGKSGRFPRYTDGRKTFFIESEVLKGLKR